MTSWNGALPNDYDFDPSCFLSAGKHPHDDVHPYVAAQFAAAGARTVRDVDGGNGRLARLLPGLFMSPQGHGAGRRVGRPPGHPLSP